MSTNPKDNQTMDFATIIASSVHDMKNSLGMLLNAINTLELRYPANNPEDQRVMAVLQYEASRVNTLLVQLLGLYKLKNEQLPIHINYYHLDDFLPDQIFQYKPLIDSKNIQVDIDIEEDLDGFFDADLVANVINNILGNTIRYTKSKILVSAYYDDYLVFEVCDDGDGYPEAMVLDQGQYMHRIDHSTGSTGLGLFFADRIATLHQKDQRHGFIKLFNGGQLGGGVFQLHLP